MYYLIYGFLYLLSLLPFPIIYGIGSGVYILLYYVFGYRREVVMQNLFIAFPEKSEAERLRIAKQFYKSFIDTFIETIKVISMSDKEFDKRTVGDFDQVNALIAQGRNIQVMGGHQFNWEFANLVFAKRLNVLNIGVYGAIGNKTMERVFLKIRSKYGTLLVSTAEFKLRTKELTANPYAMYLVADQNPLPQNGYWMYYFSKPVPFIMGPHKAAVKTNSVIVFSSFYKVKRGHYSFNIDQIIEQPTQYKPEAIALMYRNYLESVIRKQPENYLWSHRRWRYDYSVAYQQNWIDTKPAPIVN
ncbi:MAG: lysophospholipid acyltransferase family protein [Ferruginibacter sp.]